MNRYVTDIERLKRLEPVMERCGVEACKYLSDYIYGGDVVGLQFKDKSSKGNLGFYGREYKTYDYAALESVLPDWVFNKPTPKEVNEKVLDTELDKIYFQRDLMRYYRGIEKLNAMCDLILLLDDNGIELRRCESE